MNIHESRVTRSVELSMLYDLAAVAASSCFCTTDNNPKNTANDHKLFTNVYPVIIIKILQLAKNTLESQI